MPLPRSIRLFGSKWRLVTRLLGLPQSGGLGHERNAAPAQLRASAAAHCLRRRSSISGTRS